MKILINKKLHLVLYLYLIKDTVYKTVEESAPERSYCEALK